MAVLVPVTAGCNKGAPVLCLKTTDFYSGTRSLKQVPVSSRTLGEDLASPSCQWLQEAVVHMSLSSQGHLLPSVWLVVSLVSRRKSF